jgi:hypothetical protein
MRIAFQQLPCQRELFVSFVGRIEDDQALACLALEREAYCRNRRLVCRALLSDLRNFYFVMNEYSTIRVIFSLLAPYNAVIVEWIGLTNIMCRSLKIVSRFLFVLSSVHR